MPTTNMPLAPMTPDAAISAFSYLRAVQADDVEAAREFASGELRMPELLVDVVERIVVPVKRGITLSSSQVYRLVVERPERLSLRILMALLDILDCTMDDLIEPVAAAGAAATSRTKKEVGAEAGFGDLRPKRARIRGAERS
ncbi:helix-turn-helix transcriptional regulator [Streptomyces mutabilis]|uniref:helix-turn-helix domain-containing protein n=1 Tax=Streptomyces mutabilis TaxID=67332 RepID=UPI00339E2501